MLAHTEARDGLIGWLPEELVLFHVVPRLPWYTRPVCRAISKSWRALIDTCMTKAAPELELRTRQYQLPLLRGLFFICTSDGQVFISREPVGDEKQGPPYYAVERLGDEMDREWRRFDKFLMHRQFRSLPCFDHLLPSLYRPEVSIIANSGRVYVWFDDEEYDFVLKMDMGCGDWTWKDIPAPYPFFTSATDFNSKIYLPTLSTQASVFVPESESEEEEEVVLVYDMMTDLWKYVETWDRDNLRVLLKKSSCCSTSAFKEDLYSVTERQSGSNRRLEVLVYDACGDSWGIHADIPMPDLEGPKLWQIQLLNGDCFEPASEMGTNIVWMTNRYYEIACFDVSAFDPSALILINYNPEVEGRHLECVKFIRGSLYGIFLEGKEKKINIKFRFQGGKQDCKNGEKEEIGWEWDAVLWKRTIRKGKICVARSVVEWEEVHEIGYFEESCETRAFVGPPISQLTLMA